VRAGFSAVFRNPGVAPAEIAWRWSFGAAALALVLASALQFLRSLPVSGLERWALRSGNPLFIAEAMQRIVAGAGARLAAMAAILTPALALLWVISASIGRAATLGVLVDRAEDNRKSGMRPMLHLHFLRAALALTAMVGWWGGLNLAGRATLRDQKPNLALFWLLALLLSVVISFVWSTINWYLSLAPVFVVRDGRGSLGAMQDAIDISRRRGGSFATVGLVFGVLKVFILGVAIVLSLAPLRPISRVAAVAWVVAVSLVYFAASDWLQVARLAAHAAIIEDNRGVAPVATVEPLPPAPAETAQGLPSIVPGDEQLTPLHEAIEGKQ